MSETAARFVVRSCCIPPVENLVLRVVSDGEVVHGCAMCAGPVQAGDPCISVNELPSTFTSQAQLSAGRVICEPCTRIGTQEWMQKYATGIVTDGAVYPFRKFIDVAYWIANPPRQPYVMVASTAKMQHIYWCAEVSKPGEVGILCLGGRNFLIRFPLLRAAWSTALAFHARLAKAQDEAPTQTIRAKLPPPHGLLMNAFDSQRRLLIYRSEISRVASDQERSAVLGLNPGEIFLLARIQVLKPDRLQRPVPILNPG